MVMDWLLKSGFATYEGDYSGLWFLAATATVLLIALAKMIMFFQVGNSNSHMSAKNFIVPGKFVPLKLLIPGEYVAGIIVCLFVEDDLDTEAFLFLVWFALIPILCLHIYGIFVNARFLNEKKWLLRILLKKNTTPLLAENTFPQVITTVMMNNEEYSEISSKQLNELMNYKWNFDGYLKAFQWRVDHIQLGANFFRQQFGSEKMADAMQKKADVYRSILQQLESFRAAYLQMEKGNRGEERVLKNIQHLEVCEDITVYNSLVLPNSGELPVENDFLLVTDAGIFSIEVKNKYENRRGLTIEFDDGGFAIVRNDRGRELERSTSIAKQCAKHSMAVRKLLNKYDIQGVPVYPIVVMANDELRIINHNRSFDAFNYQSFYSKMEERLNKKCLDKNQRERICRALEQERLPLVEYEHTLLTQEFLSDVELIIPEMVSVSEGLKQLLPN